MGSTRVFNLESATIAEDNNAFLTRSSAEQFRTEHWSSEHIMCNRGLNTKTYENSNLVSQAALTIRDNPLFDVRAYARRRDALGVEVQTTSGDMVRPFFDKETFKSTAKDNSGQVVNSMQSTFSRQWSEDSVETITYDPSGKVILRSNAVITRPWFGPTLIKSDYRSGDGTMLGESSTRIYDNGPRLGKSMEVTGGLLTVAGLACMQEHGGRVSQSQH